jgi:protoporphyrinogen oxidase
LRVAVLGGGISGVSAAWFLLRPELEGIVSEVVLLEKEEVPGGLCGTVEMEGHRFDYGPHNIHSVDPWFNSLMSSMLGDDYRARVYQPLVQFRGKFVPYPMRGLDILKGVSPLLSTGCAASFLWSRIESLFREWRDDSFEDFIVNRFGRMLYDVYFGPFTQKTWGVPGSAISSDFGRQRIGIFNLWDLFKRTFLGIRPRNMEAEEDPFLNSRCYYPDLGSGVIVDDMLRSCSGDPRFTLVTGCPVTGAGTDGGRLTRVLTGLGPFEADVFLSSIPLTEMAGFLGAGSGLRFTSTRFLFLALSERFGMRGAPWIYFSDRRTEFNRVCSMTRMSERMSPPGGTSLCVEFTSTASDSMWTRSPESLLESALSGLSRFGLVDPAAVESWRVADRRNTYPLRLVGYREELARTSAILESVPNLISFGRLGGFGYLNMDHCVAAARDAVLRATSVKVAG